MYVNDFCTLSTYALHCHFQQYPDGAKLYSIIKSFNDVNDFQYDPTKWPVKWLVNFDFTNSYKYMQLGNYISAMVQLKGIVARA